jgi:nucleoside 2-deoxyribosyltransferase
MAAEYAGTISPENFQKVCREWLKVPPAKMAKLGGVSLPWEERGDCNIYIAAPDFDFVDTRPIDSLVESLRYHNFSPRCPVREHGQVGKNAKPKRRQHLFNKDMCLLGECSILIAVLLYEDPGTLIEIGIASERGMPVIIYDPYKRAENLMLTELPYLISSDLDEIIAAVFELVQNAKKE